MALDAATLALTAAELKATLTDAKIAKIFEPTRDELVITLRTRTDTYALLLSARSGSARVCLFFEHIENIKHDSFSFLFWLRYSITYCSSILYPKPGQFCKSLGEIRLA
jgi:predicted ribosome quality control (RQC) complex YloA/Tae2 family protein